MAQLGVQVSLDSCNAEFNTYHVVLDHSFGYCLLCQVPEQRENELLLNITGKHIFVFCVHLCFVCQNAVVTRTHQTEELG